MSFAIHSITNTSTVLSPSTLSHTQEAISPSPQWTTDAIIALVSVLLTLIIAPLAWILKGYLK
jgi:hypothetical protein